MPNDLVTITITDAKATLADVVRRAEDHDVTLLRYGHPAAMITSYARFEDLLEHLEDLDDRLSVYESQESESDMRIPHGKVVAELGVGPAGKPPSASRARQNTKTRTPRVWAASPARIERQT